MSLDLNDLVVRVLDTETSGFPPKGKVVEMAYIDLVEHNGRWQVKNTFTSLYNPGHPIPDGARNVHGISDDMVAYAPAEWKAKGDAQSRAHEETFDRQKMLWVAHNRDFDAKMLGMEDLDWICTLKIARQTIKSAPNHKLETLKDHLNLDVHFPEGWETNAHRAGFDAAVCAELFAYLVPPSKLAQDLDRLTEIAKEAQVPFGKHRGKKWSEVDDGYLAWMSKQDFVHGDVKLKLDQEIARRSGGGLV